MYKINYYQFKLHTLASHVSLIHYFFHIIYLEVEFARVFKLYRKYLLNAKKIPLNANSLNFVIVIKKKKIKPGSKA